MGSDTVLTTKPSSEGFYLPAFFVLRSAGRVYQTVNIHPTFLEYPIPFGLSLTKPESVLRQAQGERRWDRGFTQNSPYFLP